MRSSLGNLLTTCALTSGSLCLSLTLAKPAQANPAGTYFYGIDNSNTIYQVNPLLSEEIVVNPTGLSVPGGSNGIAYDTARNQLFFFYNPATQGQNQPYDLRFWNRKSSGPSSLQTVASSTDTGAPLGSTNRIPTNAAYYNNALWYFDGDPTSTTLRQLNLTYNGTGDAIVSTSITNYDLSTYAGTPTYPGGIYGDVAINTTNGILYGSTTNGNYYKIDLNALGSTSNTVYTDLGQIETLDSSGSAFLPSGLQLSFNADYSKLYGTRFCNLASDCTGYVPSAAAGDGIYFEIADFDNPSAGTRQLSSSSLLYFGSPGFRDLGGATDNPLNSVPGPVPAMGFVAAFAWSRRMRRRRISSISLNR
jgi:hypothetical protein